MKKRFPTSTVFKNPAWIQFLITRFCCESLSTRSLYFCKKFSCARISIESLGVIFGKFAGANNGSDCSDSTGLPVLASQVLTQIWDCSVDTQLITENCAKNSYNRLHRHRSEKIIFHLLCFWAFLETMDSWLDKLGVRFLWIWSRRWSFLGPGSETKWYFTPLHCP